MKLAGLGYFYHWPRADLLDLTASQMAFWEAAAGQFLEEARAAQGDS